MAKYYPTAIALLLLAFAGCGDESEPGQTAAASFISDQRIVYSDGLHNENTDLIRLDDRILLAFRGGESGQTGSAKAHINIFESTDDGRSFHPLSEVDANNLPGDRDIRDPKLVQLKGRLFLYAISRLPGAHYRDLFGQAWTVRAESTDGGRTWSTPEKTFTDLAATSGETFWGFWRFTKRVYRDAGLDRLTLFATGYNDGDTAVSLFASDDGITWERRGSIIRSAADVPSEAELQFFGDNQQTAVALVRLDNQDILAQGQTAICTAPAPFTDWECGRRIEQRFDGPIWVQRSSGAQTRNFVFARKHLPCTLKRTAAYELRGDLAVPGGTIQVCEIQELQSSGDTAYTALVPISDTQALLTWYSSTTARDVPWLEGQFTPSDIWGATIDFHAAPQPCTPPASDAACPLPALPAAAAALRGGEYLLTLGPVIWPAQTVSFRASLSTDGANWALSLQPLDAITRTPTGTAWQAANVTVDSAGVLHADFGFQDVPPAAYPLLDDPFLRLGNFQLFGKAFSADGFCGYALGFAQVLGDKEADRIGLDASTFGALRITGDSVGPVLSACPVPES